MIFHGNNVVAWSSKKQHCVALSSAEAEFVAAAVTAQELLNIKGIAKHLQCSGKVNTLLVDNQSAICMSKSYENSKRTKHVDIKYHFLKYIIEKKLLQIDYVSTNDNLSDLITKSLGSEKFYKFVNVILN